MMSSPFSIPAENRRIDPARQRADGSPDDNDRTEIGPTPLAFAEWAQLGLQPPNLASMREFRLQRIKEQLVARDLSTLELLLESGIFLGALTAIVLNLLLNPRMSAAQELAAQAGLGD